MLVNNYKDGAKTILLDEVEEAFKNKEAGSDLVDIAVSEENTIFSNGVFLRYSKTVTPTLRGRNMPVAFRASRQTKEEYNHGEDCR